MTNEKTQALFEQIQKSRNEIANIKKELSEKVKLAFHEASKELFSMYPELKSFGWNQYTPYFNDGEPCYFSANVGDPTINGFEDYDDDEGGEDNINLYAKAESNPRYQEIIDNVNEFLGNFDDDDYESIFGDHVSVTVTATGTETQDYDHD